jgi:negative regulator of flagellin synthesis FlgM
MTMLTKIDTPYPKLATGVGSANKADVPTSAPATLPATPQPLSAPLQLSAVAQAHAAPADQSPVNTARVMTVKQQIAQGTYSVNPEKIADCMIEFDLGWTDAKHLRHSTSGDRS